jgi:exosortase
MTQARLTRWRVSSLSALVALLAIASVLWSYWSTLGEVAERWSIDPQYSHGYLVPGFAALLLWLRRRELTRGSANVDTCPNGWGWPLLAAAIALRMGGSYYHFVWFDAVSLLPCLAALCLLLGGTRALRWAAPAIAFLFFMIPLPYQVAVAMAGPLQQVATTASTYLLQTLGLPAVAEGNVILLNEASLNIVEACSGLRMLVVFFALSTAVGLVARRPFWERVFLAFSAIPIALFVNMVRITATGVIYETVGSETGHYVFHDLAGWLMMPLALALLGLELKFLTHLLSAPAPLTTRALHSGLIMPVRSPRSPTRPARKRAIPAPPTEVIEPAPTAQEA